MAMKLEVRQLLRVRRKNSSPSKIKNINIFTIAPESGLVLSTCTGTTTTAGTCTCTGSVVNFSLIYLYWYYNYSWLSLVYLYWYDKTAGLVSSTCTGTTTTAGLVSSTCTGSTTTACLVSSTCTGTTTTAGTCTGRVVGLWHPWTGSLCGVQQLGSACFWTSQKDAELHSWDLSVNLRSSFWDQTFLWRSCWAQPFCHSSTL